MKHFTDCRCNSDRDSCGLCAAGIAECYDGCPFYFKVEKPTNADRIRGMSDEELAKELTRNPSTPCRMCEYYNHKLGYCDAPHDFVCVTAYAEALTLDWLKQPAGTEGTE